MEETMEFIVKKYKQEKLIRKAKKDIDNYIFIGITLSVISVVFLLSGYFHQTYSLMFLSFILSFIVRHYYSKLIECKQLVAECEDTLEQLELELAGEELTTFKDKEIEELNSKYNT